MTQYLLFGAGFAFAACVQPGPLQTFLLSRTLSDGWKKTLPAAFSPLLSDGPIALIVLLIVGHIPLQAQNVLRAAGGILLLYLAYAAFRQSRSGDLAGNAAVGSHPRTLLQAATVNLLNPNPYLGWALILGPAVSQAWRQNPAFAVILLAAFYGTMVAALAGMILLAGTAGALSPGNRRRLVLLSALVLAALGIYQIILSIAWMVER